MIHVAQGFEVIKRIRFCLGSKASCHDFVEGCLRILLGFKNLYYLGKRLLVLLGKALCEPLALKNHQLLVDASSELYLGVVMPGFEDVVVGGDVEVI